MEKETKKYLDEKGLKILWEKIKEYQKKVISEVVEESSKDLEDRIKKEE